jgi:thiosulfate sulfurtransferase
MFQRIKIKQVSEFMDGGAPLHIVDIRDPQSFAAGHITGAIPLDNNTAAAFIANTPKDDNVVVCCYHGNSSQGAAQFLAEQGFTKVYSLDGGFEMWNRGKPDKVEV